MIPTDYEPEYRCQQCGHDSRHFSTEDALGRYTFCLVQNCDCIIEVPHETA